MRRCAEKARPRGVADPLANAERLRLIAELSRAAQAFASGRDGSSMVPSEIRAEVQRWRAQLVERRLTLDHERWLLGLLTLARLELAPGAGRAAAPGIHGVRERGE